MDPWDNHLLGGVECRKEIWYITKVQMVLLRIEERLIWTFSVILPMAAFADAIILKNHPICRQGSSNFFLIGLSFSDRGQAWRLPSEHRVFLFKAPRWGTWTATRMALPLMSLICRFHGSRRSPYRPCHRLTLMWWPPNQVVVSQQVASHVVASPQVASAVPALVSRLLHGSPLIYRWLSLLPVLIVLVYM